MVSKVGFTEGLLTLVIGIAVDGTIDRSRGCMGFPHVSVWSSLACWLLENCSMLPMCDAGPKMVDEKGCADASGRCPYSRIVTVVASK